MDEDAGVVRDMGEMWHMHNAICGQQERVVERVGAEVACIVPTP